MKGKEEELLNEFCDNRVFNQLNYVSTNRSCLTKQNEYVNGFICKGTVNGVDIDLLFIIIYSSLLNMKHVVCGF